MKIKTNENHFEKNNQHCIYAYTYNSKGSVINCNWHKEQELIYVEKGILKLTVEDTVSIIHEGEIGCVNAGRMHYGTSLKNNSSEIKAISILIDLNFAITKENDNEYIKGLALGLLNFPPVIKKSTKNFEQIKNDILKINEIMKNKNYQYELKLRSILFDLFYYFTQIPNFFSNQKDWDNAHSKEKRDRIFAAFDFIDKNFDDQISIEDISNHVKMKSNSFYKMFSAITGVSPIKYLINTRLSKSKELLENTDASVTEICFQTGFSNISYFIKQFKIHYGVTPNSFRLSTK